MLGYMDILNSFVLVNKGTKINNENHYGIKFIKKDVYEEIFTSDEEILKKWFNSLKKFCFLT